MELKNIFTDIPTDMKEEIFQTILSTDFIRIERIISKGQSSPENFWYDQNENEWVIVLQGKAIIKYDDSSIITLKKGDFLLIPAHKKHRVEWTDPNDITIWLAIFFK